MVKSFLQRIQKSVADAYDPGRDERVKRLAVEFYNGLRTKRQEFNLQQAVAGLDISRSDIRKAAESAFRRLLDNVWNDDVVSKSERETITWVVRCLEISEKESRAIQKEYAINRFRVSLARAMDDGILTDEEFNNLDQIASAMGATAPLLAREFFRDQAGGFLHSMFLTAIEEGTITQDSWNSMVKTCNRFGITSSEFIRLIELPARQFVEHVLADAKSDGELSAKERKYINSYLTVFQLDTSFCDYVRREMDEFDFLCGISQGRLPSLTPPSGLGVRSGELVHACADADLSVVRILQSGRRQDLHRGVMYVLDSRAIFQSETKAQSINYRKIIALRGESESIELQLNGKPVWTLRLHQENPHYSLIFRTAVALANQTMTQRSDGTPSRHVARDVRQRVWQRYGGQCADCGARDYLEFDHIIPVAKGGSNHEGNIQLLCRRCNLKKSDLI